MTSEWDNTGVYYVGCLVWVNRRTGDWYLQAETRQHAEAVARAFTKARERAEATGPVAK